MNEEIIKFVETIKENSSFIERKQIVQYMRRRYRGKERSIEARVDRFLKAMCVTGILSKIGVGVYSFTKIN